MEINTINLVGRAGREPDVRYFESGSTVANFTLAVNRRSRDEEPDWFNLEIWGKQAQIAADYVKKGSLIGITGSFKIDSWKDKNLSLIHISEPTRQEAISYAVFCLKKKKLIINSLKI